MPIITLYLPRLSQLIVCIDFRLVAVYEDGGQLPQQITAARKLSQIVREEREIWNVQRPDPGISLGLYCLKVVYVYVYGSNDNRESMIKNRIMMMINHGRIHIVTSVNFLFFFKFLHLL